MLIKIVFQILKLEFRNLFVHLYDLLILQKYSVGVREYKNDLHIIKVLTCSLSC